MKALVSFAFLLLAACATASPTAPGPITPQERASPDANAGARIAQLLRGAGGERAPTQAEVERALGPADLSRQDGAGAALTYRYETCALLLLFAADERNTMRLAEANPGPRRSGETAPSLEACAAEASARRS